MGISNFFKKLFKLSKTEPEQTDEEFVPLIYTKEETVNKDQNFEKAKYLYHQATTKLEKIVEILTKLDQGIITSLKPYERYYF